MSRGALVYHDRTKHAFHRFARSLGYLDWATQPDPFRRYDGARLRPLTHVIPTATEISPETIAAFLRCSLGLSAWKQYGSSRWALRVNPSSGNLHPTEGYIVTSAFEAGRLSVCHYAPREHALEERCSFDASGLAPFASPAAFLVGLTSIHWREAWKYGERAFRYCQHDVGHALGALRVAASLFGWTLTLLPRWSDRDMAALLGVDRSVDDVEAEAPDCLMIVLAGVMAGVTAEAVDPFIAADPASLVSAARNAEWHGTPNRLSASRMDWPAIEDVVQATEYPGSDMAGATHASPSHGRPSAVRATHGSPLRNTVSLSREVILQRRSAVAFDGHGSLPKATFVSMLQRLVPPAVPWDAIWWTPHVHLVLFVHRVDGLPSGIYAYVREPSAQGDLRAAMRDDLLWESVADADGLFLLAPLDCRAIARRLSCDQDIASDGFFGVAMLARVDEALRTYGEWFYRHLFWECGLIGQVLYLEAEAAGARATGIGCFYDDPVHDLLGLQGHAWQSLYHFSMGIPEEDTRLTTEPGYAWESDSGGV